MEIVIGNKDMSVWDGSLFLTYAFCVFEIYDIARDNCHIRFADARRDLTCWLATFLQDIIKKAMVTCATLAREIASPLGCRPSGFGTGMQERTFAIVRRLSRYDQSLEAVSNAFISVIHHSVLRSDSDREENLDVSKRRIRLPDATFPPRNGASLPFIENVTFMVMSGMSRTGVKLPVGAVRFMAEKMGFADLGAVLQLLAEGHKSPVLPEWTFLLHEMYDLESLTPLRGASTSQARILTTSDMSKDRIQKAAPLAGRSG
jgi:hypothetical protein